ncbi:hypothetical protein RRG08_031583 [Elysia crispata]|uniref:Uncharacterized protein n=1 Tax=Elysia crispata TaxID=231223 RepID=A0AAE1E8V2_9GAST|nr:hypothetical protein RRG08_031583 [Elysia crispata]KAK3798571.1 hypothetical protein RRG08_031583 [Elysia crispata]KAK3798572.1 hypothetical protein RRG08_031583 [Elysia crispata]
MTFCKKKKNLGDWRERGREKSRHLGVNFRPQTLTGKDSMSRVQQEMVSLTVSSPEISFIPRSSTLPVRSRDIVYTEKLHIARKVQRYRLYREAPHCSSYLWTKVKAMFICLKLDKD